MLAEIQHLQGNYSQSNETLYELHRSFNSYEIWYDRSYLLIADNFISLQEAFQAKQTLQSLIDNSKLSFIIELAKARLKELVEEKESLAPDTLQIIETEIDSLNDTPQN